jgi:hypothetical protein
MVENVREPDSSRKKVLQETLVACWSCLELCSYRSAVLLPKRLFLWRRVAMGAMMTFTCLCSNRCA